MRFATIAITALAASAAADSANLRGDRQLAGPNKKLYAVDDLASMDYGGLAVVRATGKAWVWGDENAPAPFTVAETAAGVEIPVLSFGSGHSQFSEHTCAILKPNKALRCWGENDNGELGTGDTTDVADPLDLTSDVMTGVDDVATGSDHTCAIKSGNLFCWGKNDVGQLGRATGVPVEGLKDGTAASALDTTIPTLVGGVTKVACAYDMCCALQSGDLYCWGDNASGQVGVGSEEDSFNTPQRVKLPYSAKIGNAVADFDVGGDHACAVMASSGAAFCWGYNDYGELGGADLDDNEYNLPQRVTIPRRLYAVRVATSDDATCFIYSNGKMGCCGDSGDLGDMYPGAGDIFAPITMSSTVFPRDIVAGSYHFCVRDKNRFVLCWGDNDDDELGGSVFPPNDGARTFVKFEEAGP
jgi:alpha-tubulin suppressor-like RCC1 family protein